ncbi:fumarylacetoacetate hydrolase family protein [bacterium]|nr:fumarylacetoacetate hydrolase family protein [bacterium]
MTRFIRFELDGAPAWGETDGETVTVLDGSIGAFTATARKVQFEGLRLLAPATPGKILAVGLNYRSHLQGRPAPARPELFYKPPSALVGPEEAILLPPDAADPHFEGELVVVMGKRARHVSPEEARSCVFGYTAGNDVSDRQWQANDRQWWRAKGCDTFAPLGPWIVSALSPDAVIRTRAGGEVYQEAPLSDLIFDVAQVVSFASRYLTLEAGDLIFTGTPGHTRAMQPGETVEVEVTGLGTLRNPVRRLEA